MLHLQIYDVARKVLVCLLKMKFMEKIQDLRNYKFNFDIFLVYSKIIVSVYFIAQGHL